MTNHIINVIPVGGTTLTMSLNLLCQEGPWRDAYDGVDLRGAKLRPWYEREN
jgi:hypothetical protein